MPQRASYATTSATQKDISEKHYLKGGSLTTLYKKIEAVRSGGGDDALPVLEDGPVAQPRAKSKGKAKANPEAKAKPKARAKAKGVRSNGAE